jgi:hypothetical protein
MSANPWPSDEGARHLVNEQTAILVGHLPPVLAGEVEGYVTRREISWGETGHFIEQTVLGDLTFQAGGRVWHLAHERETGRSFVQVTVLPTTPDGSFASTSYQDGEEVGSLLDRMANVEFLRADPGSA